jgi:hypothetical protein
VNGVSDFKPYQKYFYISIFGVPLGISLIPLAFDVYGIYGF